jgi:hypothetical protein
MGIAKIGAYPLTFKHLPHLSAKIVRKKHRIPIPHFCRQTGQTSPAKPPENLNAEAQH